MASFQVFNWTSSEPIHRFWTLLLIGRHDAWFIIFRHFSPRKDSRNPFSHPSHSGPGWRGPLAHVPWSASLSPAIGSRKSCQIAAISLLGKIYHPPLEKKEFRWTYVVFLKGREMSKNPQNLNDSWQPRNPRRLFQAPTFGLTDPKWGTSFGWILNWWNPWWKQVPNGEFCWIWGGGFSNDDKNDSYDSQIPNWVFVAVVQGCWYVVMKKNDSKVTSKLGVVWKSELHLSLEWPPVYALITVGPRVLDQTFTNTTNTF